jgi:hypothetical protein
MVSRRADQTARADPARLLFPARRKPPGARLQPVGADPCWPRPEPRRLAWQPVPGGGFVCRLCDAQCSPAMSPRPASTAQPGKCRSGIIASRRSSLAAAARLGRASRPEPCPPHATKTGSLKGTQPHLRRDRRRDGRSMGRMGGRPDGLIAPSERPNRTDSDARTMNLTVQILL